MWIKKNLLLSLACLTLFMLSLPFLAKTAACHPSCMGSRQIQHAGFVQIFGPKSQDFFQNNNLFFQTQRYQMWPLTQKRYLRTNARHANAWQANGWEMNSQAIRNGTAEWVNGWRKFLNGWGRVDEQMTKIFEWMQSNGWGRRVDKRMKKIFERMNGWRKILSDWLWCAEYFSLPWVGANSRGVRYVFNGFLRSRKAFACSRKNYYTVVNTKFSHVSPNGFWRIFGIFLLRRTLTE